MKIILTQNIPSLGKAGEVKNVADGYAVNFLFPKKFAVIANPVNIEKQQAVLTENRKQGEKILENLKKMARELSGMEIEIGAKAKDGKLFGSIGAKEIMKALGKKDISVETNQIIIPEPIKEIGEPKVTIRLNKDIEASITVKIGEI